MMFRTFELLDEGDPHTQARLVVLSISQQHHAIEMMCVLLSNFESLKAAHVLPTLQRTTGTG